MPRLADKQGLAQPKLDGLAVPADMQSATHPLCSLLPTKNERPYFFLRLTSSINAIVNQYKKCFTWNILEVFCAVSGHVIEFERNDS